MRLLKELALTPGIKCSIFTWNEKFIVKLESGNLEQTIKIPVYEVAGEDELESRIHSREWIHKVEKNFSELEELENQLLDF